MSDFVGRYEYREGTSDKFYVVWAQPNGFYTLAWGRNGQDPQGSKIDQSEVVAREKVREKTAKGYRFISKQTGFAQYDSAGTPPPPPPPVTGSSVSSPAPKVLDDGMMEVAGIRLPRYDCLPEFRSLVPEADPRFCWTPQAVSVLLDLHPRTTVLKGAAAIEHRAARNVLLTGHTGSGKTAVIRQICAVFGQPVIRVNCNGQLMYSDFVGSMGLKSVDGASCTEFVEGALPKCVRHGFVLLVDELDYAEAEILGGLNPVLEPGEGLHLKEKGDEVVPRHPWFRVAATANTAGSMEVFRDLYPGTKPLNLAFLNRWDVHQIPYLSSTQEKALLGEKVPKLARLWPTQDVATALVKVANEIRGGFAAGTLQTTISTRDLLSWADKSVRRENPMTALETTILNKIADPASREATLQIARRVIAWK